MQHDRGASPGGEPAEGGPHRGPDHRRVLRVLRLSIPSQRFVNPCADTQPAMAITAEIDQRADQPRLFGSGRHRAGPPGRPQKRLLDHIPRLLPVRREAEGEPEEALVMGVEEAGQPFRGLLSGGIQDRARGQRCVHNR